MVWRVGRRGARQVSASLSVPDQTGHVGGARPGRARHRQRIDYRTYRRPVFTELPWGGHGGAGGRAVQPAGQQRAPVVRDRRYRYSAVRAGQAGHHLLHRRAARTAHAPDQQNQCALAPIGLLVLVLFGLIILEPDFGTSMSLVLIAAVMVFAAGLNYRYIVGAALCAIPVAWL